MKLKRANEAISEIVGTVLLLGMAVLFFSTLCFIVLSFPASSYSPSVNLVGTIKEEYLLLGHRGGDALSLETKVIITIGNKTEKFTVGDKNYLDDEAKEDNLWGLGEWVIYHNQNLTGRQVSITVVDVESNFVIMTGLLQGT